MLPRLVAIGCAAIATACVSGSGPQATPDNDRPTVQAATNAPSPLGLIYANRACGTCHAVAPGQTRSPNPKAPTFEIIADTPGMTPMALNVWLHSSLHRDMPYVPVETDQLEALAEYVYSLRK